MAARTRKVTPPGNGFFATTPFRWPYTGGEQRYAVWKARCHFMRRKGIEASVAAYIAAGQLGLTPEIPVQQDAWPLIAESHGRQYTNQMVGKLTACYLRWNRGDHPLTPSRTEFE